MCWIDSLQGDSTNLHEKIFHYSQLTAAVLFPISFVLAPSALCVGECEAALTARSPSTILCVFCILCMDALV